MNVAARRRAPFLQIVVARLHQRLGLPGLLGLGLLLIAALVLSLAWREHRPMSRVAHLPELPGSVDPFAARGGAATPSQPRTKATLPSPTDVPLLLTRIQRAALDAGLGWPRADYRFNPATDEAPASLEVQCALKGPYPAVRRFVTALLQDTPTLTLREFNLSRANPDAGDVDAKLSIVVYVASEQVASAGALR